MPHVNPDRVWDRSSTTGTGDYTISGSPPIGFLSLLAGIGVGNSAYLVASMGADFEIFRGTLSDANTLERTEIIASTNANEAVDWTSGVKDIYSVYPGARIGSAAAAETSDFATAAQGALADTAVQEEDLAAVATSGAYSDLTGTPSTATDSVDGLMSATDKAKLDTVESGAQVNTVTSVAGKTGTVTLTAADASAIGTDQKGAASGVATLDAGGKIPSSQLPPLAIVDVFTVADIAERDELDVQAGDIAIVLDGGDGLPHTYIWSGSAWVEIRTPGGVSTFNGREGTVNPESGDYSADQVTFSPAGNVEAETVQAAIQELDSEKLGVSHAGSGGGAHAIAVADGAAGFMSGADKAKLDDLDSDNYATAAQGAKADTAVQPEDVGTIAGQDADDVDIDGGAIDGVSIGGSTPGTGVFTTLIVTGQASFGGAEGAESLRVLNVENAVNRLQISGAATSGAVEINAKSETDTNVELALAGQGTGVVKIGANGGDYSVRVNGVPNAVNRWAFNGAAAGQAVSVFYTGTDTDIGANWVSKGAGAHSFYSNSTALQVRIAAQAAAANYLQLQGATTGNGPILSSQGSDGAVPLKIQAKSNSVELGTSAPALHVGAVWGCERATWVRDVINVPTTPASGGVLYSQAGVLKWIGSSGTVTPLAPA